MYIKSGVVDNLESLSRSFRLFCLKEYLSFPIRVQAFIEEIISD